jgi:DNA-binding MarR family transcriptional regulator
VVDLIELLFFAYRDFISDPDAILKKSDFGRAHHRVLHFVERNPGLTVADLLDILKITKQSLARVLKQLIDSGLIEQRTGREDRRQRLLYATAAGQALSTSLSAPQQERILAALAGLGPGARDTVARFLFGMINAAERDNAARLVGWSGNR